MPQRKRVRLSQVGDGSPQNPAATSVPFSLKEILKARTTKEVRAATKKNTKERLDQAKIEVAIMGPRALPANLAELRNPMIPPFDSAAKIEMTSGKVAAIMPV